MAPRFIPQRSSGFRAGALRALACIVLAALFVPTTAHSSGPTNERHTRHRFRQEMPRTVRADHPAILPVAEAIRTITLDPLQQIVVVHDVAHLLVEYDDDRRVYGRGDYHATLDEMLIRRQQAGWLYLRDDCDGRAVFAAHLLSALQIPWRLEASYWKRHAWIVACIDGVEYDLLDLREDDPEMKDWAYRYFGRWFTRDSRPPARFNWRSLWAERTGRDLNVGWQLGMFALDSTTERPRQRYSIDWAKRRPDLQASPFDERTLTAAHAGFPLGESLRTGGFATNDSAVPTPATEQHAPLGGRSIVRGGSGGR